MVVSVFIVFQGMNQTGAALDHCERYNALWKKLWESNSVRYLGSELPNGLLARLDTQCNARRNTGDGAGFGLVSISCLFQ